jgi:hypothetical protein
MELEIGNLFSDSLALNNLSICPSIQVFEYFPAKIKFSLKKQETGAVL